MDLSGRVQDYRVSFMRMTVDSGVATAKANLEKVEIAAQVSNYEVEEMAETQV